MEERENEAQTLRDIVEAFEEGRVEDAAQYARNRLWFLGEDTEEE